ncbi:MAG: hypothetical protein KC431_20655, partial [Myxococcales bacterium]|nr:hypothetical protein [Myxococcales bacterium]
VVNGDPSETRVNDEIFFLSTALANSDLGDRLTVRGLAPDQLEQRLRESGEDPLASVDLLVLANVRALDPALVPRLAARVRAGMGLWITVGDRVAAADYNGRYGELLPLLLREAVYAGTAPGRTEARSEALAPAQLSHPIFSGLRGTEVGAEGDLDLSATRTRRMFLLEPDPRRGADIALAFSSGAPALITRELGRGRVALLTTTIDRDWGDLPLRPGFVPLVTGTVQWLAGVGRGGKGSVVGVGEGKTLERAVPYTVTTPSGEAVPVTPPDDGEAAVFTATDEVGHYLAEAGDRGSEGGDGDERAASFERFVVAVDARESETLPTPGPSAELSGESGTVTIYEPRWRELALLALLFLAIESAIRGWKGWQGRRRPIQ